MNTTPENSPFVTNSEGDVEEFKNQLFEEDLKKALKAEREKYAPVEEVSIVGGESDEEIPPDTETPPSSVPQSSSQGNEAPYNPAAERVIENLNADQTPLTLVPNDIPSNRGEDVVRDGYGNVLPPQPDAWGGHKPK